MYFGQQYIEESHKIDNGIGVTASVIAHMIKYEHEKQRNKQSTSWANTILNDTDVLIKAEEKIGKQKTNYVNTIKKEYTGKVLSGVNGVLRKDKTNIVVNEIPEKFSYENITNKKFVYKFLSDNVHSKDVADYLINKGIDVPKNIIDRCEK